ncbi:MAG: hypothetical protein ACU0GG_21665 [Paracoccaceae bacterium]
MASAGASIGFAITQSDTIGLEWPNQYLIAAISLWALSFLAGYRTIQTREKVFTANRATFAVANQMRIPSQIVQELASGKDIDFYGGRMKFFGSLQLWMLILGAVSIIAWKIASAYSSYEELKSVFG